MKTGLKSMLVLGAAAVFWQVVPTGVAEMTAATERLPFGR